MMDMVIVANGLAIAAWITSKALLNLIQASHLWTGLPAERSDDQTSERSELELPRIEGQIFKGH